jgi:hypothetical protein
LDREGWAQRWAKHHVGIGRSARWLYPGPLKGLLANLSDDRRWRPFMIPIGIVTIVMGGLFVVQALVGS